MVEKILSHHPYSARYNERSHEQTSCKERYKKGLLMGCMGVLWVVWAIRRVFYGL